MKPAWRTLFLCVCASVASVRLAAQCPDGAPPPCTRAAPARPAAAPDPQRIAILPFRVTGADTTLAEGLAELLAAEFTGESGPRAVHMGTAIRGWRQAGGGARQPLTKPAAMRTARQMGAGFFVDGSIVGLGNRLTVSASVVSSTDGDVRHAETIRGSADSLDVLVSRLTTTLLALAGGESREGSRGVLTSSPVAMRAYLEGMSAWRRYHVPEANAGFERALREDSTFARAALMRFWSANWSGVATGQWARTTFALRERLSTADRLLLVALLGERYPVPRTPQESFGARERAAALLPESPEAQYLAGDWLFHYGGAIDADDPLGRARGYFARSFALDSQQTVLAHLVDVAVLLGDSALLRSLRPALESRATDMWLPNWLGAGYLGDRAWLSRLRPLNGMTGVSMIETLGLLPAALTAEMNGRDSSRVEGSPMAGVVWADMQGRPEAAEHILDNLPAGVPAQTAKDQRTMLASMFDGDDTAAGAVAVARLENTPTPNAGVAAERDCTVALWHAWQGEPATDTPLPAAPRVQSCVAMVELVRAWRAGAPDLNERLEAADSMVRRRLGFSVWMGYENFVLAKVWEAQGNRQRALSAIRLYPVGGFAHGISIRVREEGRLAAAVGQVDRAIRAYRLYLDYMKNAEPSMEPQIDSVKAALARLVRP